MQKEELKGMIYDPYLKYAVAALKSCVTFGDNPYTPVMRFGICGF